MSTNHLHKFTEYFGNKWLIFGYGLTLGTTIYYKQSNPSLRLRLQEYEHTLMFKILGVKFIPLYLYQLIRYGYEKAPLEQDGRVYADINDYRYQKYYNSKMSESEFLKTPSLHIVPKGRANTKLINDYYEKVL